MLIFVSCYLRVGVQSGLDFDIPVSCAAIFTFALPILSLSFSLSLSFPSTFVYIVLLASRRDALGFQGSDPATDLRGGGMLGLLQLLYFVRYYHELALKLYRFSSTRDTQDENFPFALISFKFTGIALQVCIALSESVDVCIISAR